MGLVWSRCCASCRLRGRSLTPTALWRKHQMCKRLKRPFGKKWNKKCHVPNLSLASMYTSNLSLAIILFVANRKIEPDPDSQTHIFCQHSFLRPCPSVFVKRSKSGLLANQPRSIVPRANLHSWPCQPSASL